MSLCALERRRLRTLAHMDREWNLLLPSGRYFMYLAESHLKKRFGSTVDDVFEMKTMYRQSPPAGAVLVGEYEQQSALKQDWYCGWAIPNFHRRVRRGELMPHTPWQKTTWSGSTTGMYDIWSANSTSHWWAPEGWLEFSDWALTKGEVWQHAPNAYDKYVNEAAAKIYSSGFDALTFLAELSSLRGMFTNIASKIRRFDFSYLKRRGGFSTKLKDISNDWLESRYGWRLLLRDIDDLSQLIANFNISNRTRYSERVGNSYSYTNLNVNTIEKAHYYLDQVIRDEVNVSLRGSVTADIEVPRLQFNPIVTAYELIPLSFVLDWFYTVGKSLQAASFLAKQSKYSASKGFRLEVRRNFTSEIGETKSTYSSGAHSQYGESLVVVEVRQPCPVHLTPHSTLNLNSFKVADLLGLFVQRTPRR